MIPHHIRKIAEDAGCDGLVDGLARNLYTNAVFDADTCTSEDGPFYCTSCFSEAVVHKCTDKRDHFAHHARLSPVPGKGEGGLHFNCKNEICDLLSSLYPKGKWEAERTIPANNKFGTPVLRPDISGYIDDKRIVIEVQASALSITEILKRTAAYTKLDSNILWIVPLTEQLGNLPFRPRLYEKYQHSMYYGRVYYWTVGQGLELDPVHFGIASRHVTYSEWYEDGEMKTGGDYYKPYKTIKTPIYGDRVNISSHFESHKRDAFIPNNTRKTVPQCMIWRDTLSCWWNAVEEDKYTDDYFTEIYSDIEIPRTKGSQQKNNHQEKQTKNKTHAFQSDLEAQWAIFFDTMGIVYEYEKASYDFDGSVFLPDFWLPQVGMWAEVRPSRFSNEEERKCQLLANATEKRCLLLEGSPDFRSYWALGPEYEDEDYPDTDYLLTSEYLNSESRFYCSTGYTREDPATDEAFMFGDDYIAAIEESTRLIR